MTEPKHQRIFMIPSEDTGVSSFDFNDEADHTEAFILPNYSHTVEVTYDGPIHPKLWYLLTGYRPTIKSYMAYYARKATRWIKNISQKLRA